MNGIKRSRILNARQVNLVEFCKHIGYELVNDGSGNFKVKGMKGVVVKDNYYIDHSCLKGGNTIDFCVKMLNMAFQNAVDVLCKFNNNQIANDHYSASHGLACGAGRKSPNVESKVFTLPEKSNITTQLSTYLKRKRNISYRLVDELRRKGLIYQDRKCNCVFPCYNISRTPKGAIIRGTNIDQPFKGRSANSDMDYGWVVAPKESSNTVIITESPIDSLSIMDLFPTSRGHYHLSLGGLHIKSVHKFLEQYQTVQKIVLALDNDEAGQKGSLTIKRELESLKQIKFFSPKSGKDWNEELIITKKLNRPVLR